MSLTVDALLIIVAGVASLVDTVAGGGGLIVVPTLLLAGIPPAMALGTNKLQATMGCGMSASIFLRAGKITWRDIRLGVCICFFGASLGTLAIVHMHPDFLSKLIPILILLILIYMSVFKNVGHESHSPRLSHRSFFIVFGLLLGFYDGFFGPGTGSFWVMAMIVLLGWNIKRATMHAKIYNVVSNLFSLIWFMATGHVYYELGMMMAVSSIFGARVGARLVVSKTSRFIKPFYMAMMALLFVSLCIKYYIL